MPIPLGVFDETAVASGWFDILAQDAGWFDGDFIATLESDPEEDSSVVTTGYGGGWDFDFGSLTKRIEDERQDRDDRRAELERLYRKATGQDLQDVAEVAPAAQAIRAESIRDETGPQRERLRAIERALVQLQAMVEIEQSIARLQQQIEQQTEEADIVWIASTYT